MNFHYGLKLWSSNQTHLSRAVELVNENDFSYIELTPIPYTKIDVFEQLNVPFNIHITTERHDVNIADANKREYNLKAINRCIEWADRLNAKYLILHPGFGDLNDAIEVLDEINDKRILIENMPAIGINDESMRGYDVDEIKEYISMGFGFCLDINHAVKASISLKLNYLENIRNLLDVGPSMLHISDGNLVQERDEHLDIGKGDYDFLAILELFNNHEDLPMTLETPRSDLDDDLRNLQAINEIINSL